MKIFTKTKCVLLMAIMLISCSGEESKDEDSSSNVMEILDLKTFEASDIMPTTVIVSSFIQSNTEKPIKARGVVFNTIGNPTVNDQKVEDPESIVGPNSTLLQGLEQNKKYYAKVYAISNSGAVKYGNEINFTTSKIVIVPAIITTYQATNITSNSAVLGGVISRLGDLATGGKIGVCYSSANKLPTIGDTTIYANTEFTEPFWITVKNLTNNKIYYYRPFGLGTNGNVFYGELGTFSTTQ